MCMSDSRCIVVGGIRIDERDSREGMVHVKCHHNFHCALADERHDSLGVYLHYWLQIIYLIRLLYILSGTLIEALSRWKFSHSKWMCTVDLSSTLDNNSMSGWALVFGGHLGAAVALSLLDVLVRLVGGFCDYNNSHVRPIPGDPIGCI